MTQIQAAQRGRKRRARLPATAADDRPTKLTQTRLSRWRERRSAKRLQTLQRAYLRQEHLRTAALTRTEAEQRMSRTAGRGGGM